MNRPRYLALIAAVAVLALYGLQPAQAENWSLYKNFSFAKLQLVHPKPFAKQHVVIQISQGDPQRWNLVLSNVSKMMTHFGPDNIQIVVVAYGPGLKMLFKKSKAGERIQAAERIQGLTAEGVEFDACHVTMEAMKHRTGHLPKLVDSAVVVPGGIARIMQLEQHGYNYIKP
jgi:intracellular sulfur oxidation DsrE/DsrF family protein